jgi:hypothetical protein
LFIRSATQPSSAARRVKYMASDRLARPGRGAIRRVHLRQPPAATTSAPSDTTLRASHTLAASCHRCRPGRCPSRDPERTVHAWPRPASAAGTATHRSRGCRHVSRSRIRSSCLLTTGPRGPGRCDGGADVVVTVLGFEHVPIGDVTGGRATADQHALGTAPSCPTGVPHVPRSGFWSHHSDGMRQPPSRTSSPRGGKSMSISVREVEAIKATVACCPSRCS